MLMEFEIFEFNFVDGACLNHIEYTISILTPLSQKKKFLHFSKKNIHVAKKVCPMALNC